jgi:hypothetical protein
MRALKDGALKGRFVDFKDIGFHAASTDLDSIAIQYLCDKRPAGLLTLAAFRI